MSLVPIGGFVSTPPAVTIGTAAGAVNSAAQTTYTFTSLASITSDQWPIIGVAGRATGNRSVSSLTVGGSAATLVIARVNNDSFCRIYIGQKASTGNVVVTWNGAMLRCSACVWPVANLISTTATNTDTDVTDILSMNLDIASNGAGFAYAWGGGSSSWSGLTENVDALVGSGFYHSGASGTFTTAQAGRSITCNTSPSGADVGVCASFR